MRVFIAGPERENYVPSVKDLLNLVNSNKKIELIIQTTGSAIKAEVQRWAAIRNVPIITLNFQGDKVERPLKMIEEQRPDVHIFYDPEGWWLSFALDQKFEGTGYNVGQYRIVSAFALEL